MNVEERIRELVAEGGGRAPIPEVVVQALGVAGAQGELARRLVAAAVAPLRGLALQGEAVVACARAPAAGRAFALALVTPPSPTLLPPALAWTAVPEDDRAPTGLRLAGSGWQDDLATLGRELAGSTVLALSAATARRLLRLAARLGGLEPDEEPEVVSLAAVARVLDSPIRSAEEAAALVGQPVPDSPERSARVLAELGVLLADRAELAPVELGEVAARELLPPFDFGERAFGRADVLALPDSPGVYLFENDQGEVVYVGKSRQLRRRVAGYFQPRVPERDERIREGAHALSHERTGSELSALLREHELLRDLEPALNVQVQTGPRGRAAEAGVSERSRLAVIQPSAEGGAEVILVDPRRGVRSLQLLPGDPDEERSRRAVLRILLELSEQSPRPEGVAPETEIAWSWLADRGARSSVVDIDGEPEEACALILRVATDPELDEGRIIPR